MKQLILISFVCATLLSGKAFSAPLSYDCDAESGNATTQSVVIDGDLLTITSTDTLNGMTFTASFDANYKPNGSKLKVRFLGEENGNSREVILIKTMLLGATSGFMQIRGNEDGYWSAEYSCHLP